MKKEKQIRAENATVKKEAIDVKLEFQNVDYTPLPKGTSNIRFDRTRSIESIHDLQPGKSTTYCETLAHFTKGNIGCGILGMGMAFRSGGLILSIIMVVIFSIVACYNQYILITEATYFKKKYNFKSIGFAETVALAFENGPPVFQKYSSLVRKMINFFLLLNQFGGASVYILFIAESLKQILVCYDVPLNVHTSMLLILPVMWMTCLIRQLKYIAPLSSLANLSTLAGLGLILGSSTFEFNSLSERELVGKWEDLPLAVGIFIFAIEGISLTLPLQQNMKKSEKFLGNFGVLNVGFLILIFLLSIVGFFGYWSFGNDVEESLTMNLKLRGSILSQSVIVCMMIGILSSYALALFVPVIIMLPKINKSVSTWPYYEYHVYEYALRSAIVLFTFFLAAVIPHFNLFSSLLGGISGSFLTFIFCSLGDLVSRQKKDRGKFWWKSWLAALSVIFGFIAFFICTTTTTKQIVEAIKKDLQIK